MSYPLTSYGYSSSNQPMITGNSSASGSSGVSGASNGGQEPKWESYIYTDGAGNTYELERRYIASEQRYEYKWGDDIYTCWEDVVKDMIAAMNTDTYDATSDTFNAQPGDYVIDGAGATWTLDGKVNPNGNINGTSIGVHLEPMGQGKNMGYGFSIKLKF